MCIRDRMVTINLHACEATTQETVGRGSSIDLHVCGASVCVCPRQPSRAPRCASSLLCNALTTYWDANRFVISPGHDVCVVPRHVPWDHRAFGC